MGRTRRSIRGTSLAGAVTGLLLVALAAQAEGPSPDAGKDGAQAGDDVVERDYYFVRDDLIRNKDGSVTWFYVTNHVGASTLKGSVDGLKIPGVTTTLRKRDTFGFKYNGREKRLNVDPPPRKPETDENVLILRFRPEYKDILEEFLQRFDVPEPQVFIKAKVVEVTLDSNLEYGVSWFFERGGGDPNTGAPGAMNPSAFFRGARSQFRPGSFSSSPLSPANTGLSLLFDDLTTDEGTIFATIEALQERGAANILSEPSIVATQGQLATLHTGQETPILELTTRGTSDTISTKFKETGIRLDFNPVHIGREYVKLRVRVEVSSVTGFLEFETSDSRIQNPIIAQRNAETVVTIRDGMTLVIGGLYSISEIEDRSGVPILADIPVLRFLFSKKQKTKVKSELDFFITPTILRQRLSKSIFIPPGEKDRLRRMKEKKEDGDG